jgi:hypothetical protein
MLLVVAHHDSTSSLQDPWKEGGGASVLIEVARSFASKRLGRTLVFGSFDGGLANAEGLRHYLGSLGEAQAALDIVLDLDVSSVPPPRAGDQTQEDQDPNGGARPVVLSAPSCGNSEHRAPRRLVSAALSEMSRGGAEALGARLAIGDPVIGLFSQPFESAFRTRCSAHLTALHLSSRSPGATPAVLSLSNRSFASRAAAFLDPAPAGHETDTLERPPEPLTRAAIRAVIGSDGWTPPGGRDGSWMAVGSFLAPGILVSAIGIALLIPGLIRTTPRRSFAGASRSAHALILAYLLWRRPEAILLMNALPSLAPPASSLLGFAALFLPALVFIGAAVQGALSGWVLSSRLTALDWGLLALGWVALGLAVRGGVSRASRGRKGRRK